MERAEFRIRFRGEPLPRLYDYEGAAFQHSDPASADSDFAAFTGECDLARKAVAQASLDEEFISSQGRTLSLRWVKGAQAVIADPLPRRRLVLEGGPFR